MSVSHNVNKTNSAGSILHEQHNNPVNMKRAQEIDDAIKEALFMSNPGLLLKDELDNGLEDIDQKRKSWSATNIIDSVSWLDKTMSEHFQASLELHNIKQELRGGIGNDKAIQEKLQVANKKMREVGRKKLAKLVVLDGYRAFTRNISLYLERYDTNYQQRIRSKEIIAATPKNLIEEYDEKCNQGVKHKAALASFPEEERKQLTEYHDNRSKLFHAKVQIGFIAGGIILHGVLWAIQHLTTSLAASVCLVSAKMSIESYKFFTGNTPVSRAQKLIAIQCKNSLEAANHKLLSTHTVSQELDLEVMEKLSTKKKLVMACANMMDSLHNSLEDRAKENFLVNLIKSPLRDITFPFQERRKMQKAVRDLKDEVKKYIAEQLDKGKNQSEILNSEEFRKKFVAYEIAKLRVKPLGLSILESIVRLNKLAIEAIIGAIHGVVKVSISVAQLAISGSGVVKTGKAIGVIGTALAGGIIKVNSGKGSEDASKDKDDAENKQRLGAFVYEFAMEQSDQIKKKLTNYMDQIDKVSGDKFHSLNARVNNDVQEASLLSDQWRKARSNTQPSLKVHNEPLALKEPHELPKLQSPTKQITGETNNKTKFAQSVKLSRRRAKTDVGLEI